MKICKTIFFLSLAKTILDPKPDLDSEPDLDLHQNVLDLPHWLLLTKYDEALNGLLGHTISCGSTYMRLGDCRPYVIGADRKACVGGKGKGGGGTSKIRTVLCLGCLRLGGQNTSSHKKMVQSLLYYIQKLGILWMFYPLPWIIERYTQHDTTTLNIF